MSTEITQRRVPIFPLALAEDMQTLPALPLGMVIAYLRTHEQGLLQQSYTIGRLRRGGVPEHPIEPILEEIGDVQRCVCLLSCYVWNRETNLETAREIKSANPEAIVIIGGPEVPKYLEDTELFLRNNPAIDIAVLGEGEISCAEILVRLATHAFALESLEDIPGIVYQTRME